MNTRSEPVTTYSAGIDLHKNSLRLHVIDAAGARVYQETIGEHKRKRLTAALQPFGNDVTVGLESTYNWYWVVDNLQTQGIPYRLGHARDVHKQRPGKHKSDPKDAAAMSQMIRMGTFPPAYACAADLRSTRDVLRKRLRLVAAHTQHVLHSQCVSDQYLLAEDSLAAAGYSRQVIEDVDKLLEIDTRLQVVLEELIEELDAWVLQRAVVHDQALYDLFVSTRSIGPAIALSLLYEIVDIGRFASPARFSSYCRVVNAQCESAGKTLGAGDRYRGNPYLCRAINMLAIQSVKHVPQIAAWYRRLVHRKGKRTARRTLAHKWAVAIYFMWKRREPFDIGKFLGTGYTSERTASTDQPRQAVRSRQ
jgi:transposase